MENGLSIQALVFSPVVCILIGREERPPEEEGICSTGGSNGRAEVATCGLSAHRE
jgi:hypothetical protein